MLLFLFVFVVDALIVVLPVDGLGLVCVADVIMSLLMLLLSS